MPGIRQSTDLSASDLLTTAVIDPRSRTIDQFYARSWLLVHLLTFSTERAGQRARYIGEIERGASLEDAARSAFGDLRALDIELRRYVDSPIRSATVQAAAISVPDIRITRLSPTETALLPLRIEHMRGVSNERIPTFLDSVRAVAARFPNDGQVLFLLAEAEGMAGNLDASDRAADLVLADHPRHSRALLRKARNIEARHGAAGHSQARPLIVRANRADEKDPLPLIAYYRSLRLPGEEVPVLALEGLMLAAQLAPQSSETRLIAGAALAEAGHHDQATRLLRPVAFAPHGGSSAEQAQALIQAIGGDRSGLAALADRIIRERLN